jgi:hypothetical protein
MPLWGRNAAERREVLPRSRDHSAGKEETGQKGEKAGKRSRKKAWKGKQTRGGATAKEAQQLTSRARIRPGAASVYPGDLEGWDKLSSRRRKRKTDQVVTDMRRRSSQRSESYVRRLVLSAVFASINFFALVYPPFSAELPGDTQGPSTGHLTSSTQWGRKLVCADASSPV